jgi:hypothetical protein
MGILRLYLYYALVNQYYIDAEHRKEGFIMGIMNIIVEELNKGKSENEPKWERLHSQPYEIVQTKNGCFHNPINVSKTEKQEPEYKAYKAEYIDDNFEIIHAENNSKAIEEAFTYESEHGTCENVYLIDEDYNNIEIIF